MRRSTGGKVNGLTGKEFNPVNPFDPHSPIINVSYTANDIGPDGGHSVPSTTIEVFGGLNMTFLNPAPMNGFIADANVSFASFSLASRFQSFTSLTMSSD
jgi:hypothetical protein